jgi:hypothetical protein
MKKIVLIFFALQVFWLQAQIPGQESKANQIWEFGIECPMYTCNIKGDIIDTNVLIAPPDAKFLIIDMKEDKCIIRFTLLPQNKKRISTSFYSTDDITTYTYFIITKAQLEYKAYPIIKSNIDLLVGNIFTPLKLRFKPFDFSKDISIGTTFGVKYSLGEKRSTSVDALIGLGISTLSIDSFASRGKVESTVDLLSFSPSIGLVLEFGNAQIGLFSGIDFISNANQNKYEWIYRNKPWLSFGIGYSLFSFNVKK